MLFLLVVGWIFEIACIFGVFKNPDGIGFTLMFGFIMALATALVAKKW